MSDRLRCLSILLFALVASLSTLAAQDDPKFSLTAKLTPATAKAGDRVDLVLEARTAHGWHAYGTLETTNEAVSLDTASLRLTGLELAGDAVIPEGNPSPTPVGTTYPLPEEFVVRVPLKIAAGASGEVKVEGELGYQICDASVCERPNTAAFAATLVLGGGGAGQEPQNQEPVTREPQGQQPGLKPGLTLDFEEKVSIKAKFDPPAVRAGEVSTLVLEVHVVDGWHAYGTLEETNVPVAFDHAKQEFGVLEFEGEAQIPPGEEKVTPVGSSYPLPHDFVVKQVVRVPAGTKPGEIEVLGVLDYQVCTDSFCDPVAEGEFEAKLRVEAGEARADNAAVPTVAPESNGPNDPFATWWGLILACIGGGLFALAMPCTYPMIPITFSFFTKQAEKSGGNVLMLALVYGLGIIAMFVTVGVALSAVIIDVVNHWVTNTIIGVMFVFFAFVLFGWINLNPPQWMQNLALKAQSSTMASSSESKGKGLSLGGLLGVFFMGATLVLTSFTCTAPIVGTLIASVAKHGPMRVGIGMGIFGLTMAIPFVFLAMAPTKVKAMPKSGEWMKTLKVSLGFVELAAALKFVSMVDIYFGWDVLPRERFLTIWAVIFAVWAIYLFGRLKKPGTPAVPIGATRLATGVIVVLLAGYFAYGALGNQMDKVMTGFVPAYSKHKKTALHVVVKDDPDAAMELARAQDKLLLYNFTGFN